VAQVCDDGLGRVQQARAMIASHQARRAAIALLATLVLLPGCSSGATTSTGSAPAAVTSGSRSGLGSAAAGGTDAGGTDAGGTDASTPCALLTSGDVTSLGLTSPGRAAQQLDLGPSCDYGTVVLTLVDPAASPGAFEFNATRSVSGLGDQALYGADYHWLRVRAGSTRFEVRCVLCDSDTEVATMTRIAQRVLTHVR
jgi:hypothetical protein